MPGRRHEPEEILEKLRTADELKARGATARDIARTLGVAENTYQRWRQLYGPANRWQRRRMEELEEENARLKQVVGELSLDLQRLREHNRVLERGDVGSPNGVRTIAG